MEDITASLSPREHVLSFQVKLFPNVLIILGNRDSSDCFSQAKKEDKTRLLTSDALVMVKISRSIVIMDIFATGSLVKIMHLLLSNQPLFSFVNPVTLLVIIFGS